ncbi:hypothetical protein ES703_37062 [subsurface metagenome]
MQFADPSVADKLADEAASGIGAMLSAGLQYSAVAPNGIGEKTSFGYGERQRFFTIYILTMLDAIKEVLFVVVTFI